MNIKALIRYKKTALVLSVIGISFLDLLFLAIAIYYWDEVSFMHTIATLEDSFFKMLGMTCPVVLSAGVPEVIAAVVLGVKLGEDIFERVKLMVIGLLCTYFILKYLPKWVVIIMIAITMK